MQHSHSHDKLCRHALSSHPLMRVDESTDSLMPGDMEWGHTSLHLMLTKWKSILNVDPFNTDMTQGSKTANHTSRSLCAVVDSIC
eukprot:3811813-Amphidinium_carterae.1